jgi:polyhydroxyalkanoate synthase subunit PhaC
LLERQIIEPDLMKVGSVQAMSDLLDAEVSPGPRQGNVTGFGKDEGIIVPRESHPGLAPETCQREPADTYQFDRALHGMVAGLTGGISPVALSLAYIDWAAHLAAAPQRQLAIARDGLQGANELFLLARHCLSSGQPWALIKPQPQDRRFSEPEWECAPFNLIAQGFLLQEQ